MPRQQMPRQQMPPRSAAAPPLIPWWHDVVGSVYGVGKTTHKNCLRVIADMSATLPAKVNSILPSC